MLFFRACEDIVAFAWEIHRLLLPYVSIRRDLDVDLELDVEVRTEMRDREVMRKKEEKIEEEVMGGEEVYFVCYGWADWLV